MIILLYFLLGVFFIDIVLPMLESVVGLFCMFIEQQKAKINLNITKYQTAMMECEKDSTSHPMGFHFIPKEEDDEDYDED